MTGCLLGLVLGAGVASEPVDVETQMAAGFEALARGELGEAEASFREAQRLQPRNVVVLVQLARIHLQRDEHPPAIGLLRRAIDLDPDATANYLELAAVYSRLLSFADARQTLRRLLERRPDEP